MKNNYPIRYAVMPIIEQVGWSYGLNELERNYGEVAYIVSKCYVISQTKKYLQNGEEKDIYSVVFPFEKNDYGKYYRVEPSFNLIHGQCVNATQVSKIFMTREEAMEEAKILNAKIVRNRIASLAYNSSFKEAVADIREEQKEKLEEYSFLEELSEKKTDDLVVGQPFKEQKIIVVSDGKMRFKDSSLYEFIGIWMGQKFFAYNVDAAEYEKMKEAINSSVDFDLGTVEKRLLLEGVEDSGLVEIGDYNSEQERGCFYIQGKFMSYDENLLTPRKPEEDVSDNCTKVYTLETYEDVINSYIPNFIANTYVTSKEENAVLEKKLIVRDNKN